MVNSLQLYFFKLENYPITLPQQSTWKGLSLIMKCQRIVLTFRCTNELSKHSRFTFWGLYQLGMGSPDLLILYNQDAASHLRIRRVIQRCEKASNGGGGHLDGIWSDVTGGMLIRWGRGTVGFIREVRVWSDSSVLTTILRSLQVKTRRHAGARSDCALLLSPPRWGCNYTRS